MNLSTLTKPVKMLTIKNRLNKLIKEHKNLIDIGDITSNELMQTMLKNEYVELGGKRFWEK